MTTAIDGPPGRPIIVGLGELLWDVFPDQRRPGGAPANFAFRSGLFWALRKAEVGVGNKVVGPKLHKKSPLSMRVMLD